MTYSECMQQLKEQDLYNEFCCVFEHKYSKSFLNRLLKTDRINSIASLIRSSLTFIEKDSIEWDRWVVILQWYMMPEFERVKIKININKTP